MLARHFWPAVAVIAIAPAHAQIVQTFDNASLTVEGFANMTAGWASSEPGVVDTRDGDGRIDGAVRLLGQLSMQDGPDIGARIVVQRSPENDFEIGEASVLLFGGRGRLEIGERMGLPDVLTGYAPNNFTFTGAEFGPASGPSLDPAGTLQTAFLDRALAVQLNSLSVLGFASSLFDDQSGKVLYVLPKTRGWLGGISYAPDADDPRYEDLIQVGLTHERYWAQSVLRWGGSYTFARGDRTALSGQSASAFEDLHSLNLGVTATLDDSLMLGVSATFNGDSGLTAGPAGDAASTAWGVTTSVNYNAGPWTLGAYYQYASAEGDAQASGDDRLAAVEAGVSYRFTTRVRLYGAWFHYDLADEGGNAPLAERDGNVFIMGLRLAL